MAWIELHDNLPDHPKVIDLAELLKLDKDAVVGKLIRLWVWALNSREDGFIRAKDVATVADVMRYKGKTPDRLIKAMVEVRFLDPAPGGYIIHGWDEHVSQLMQMRERRRSQERERKKRQRERERGSHADVTRDMDDIYSNCHAVTVPKPYLDDEDDTNNSLGCARAQGVIHRVSPTEIEKAYREHVGRVPSPAEVDALSNFSDPPELVVEAIKRAALNGARSIIAYVGRVLVQWYNADVQTIAQLEDWEAEWEAPFASLDGMEGV